MGRTEHVRTGQPTSVSLIIAILDKRLRCFQEAVDVAAFSSLLAHKRAECRTTAKLISSTSWMCASCSQKRKKRLRLFRYPRMVFGVYFLTSISIKYSLIAALVFMSIPPLVCRNQRGRYITAQLMYFAAEKKSVPKTRCFTENQLLFRRKSSVNPAASYARRSARPHCHPACPAAWSCCGHRPRWSW